MVDTLRHFLFEAFFDRMSDTYITVVVRFIISIKSQKSIDKINGGGGKIFLSKTELYRAYNQKGKVNMGSMKKLTSTALALMMLLGGTPIWAQTDDSSTSSDVDKSPTITDLAQNAPFGESNKVVDENGQGTVTVVDSVAISEKTYEELTKPDAMKNIIEKAGFDVPKDANVVLLGAGDYSAKEYFCSGNTYYGYGEPVEIPEGGMDIEFRAYPEYDELWKGLQDGDSIYVLHQLKNGTWEVVETTVQLNQDGVTDELSFTIRLDSLSPIAFVKVMSDGTVVKLDKEEVEQTGTTLKPGSSSAVKNMSTTKQQLSVKKSPNTGF